MNKKIIYCILALFTMLATIKQATGQTTKLINPILSGFYPDPSIVKAGSDYYLVNSTFSYFPGIPVFHSKDLKNWKQIGNVISRTSQMTFLKDRMTRGLFAPAISYSNGTFYLTCTQIDQGGNFVVTAKNAAGPWSDPVWLPNVRGIDPSLFFDDNGKAYIMYNSDPPNNQSLYDGHRTIRIYEFDPVNLKTIGDEKTLVNGGVDISKKPVWIEAPHILKANNWYYLYAAEGGTSENHSEVVFRSKTALGPFVPYEKNPILTQKNLPEDRKHPVTSAGHAQFVEGPDGKTYAIFLAVRPYEGDYYNTGRETFIAPVTWKDEWPIINADSKEIKYAYQTDYKEVKQKNALPQSGNFKYTINFGYDRDPSLLFLRSADSTAFSFDKRSGLTLKLKPETIMDIANPSFIGKRQQHLYCTLETELNFDAKAENEKAGLSIFQNEDHFYYLCKSKIKNQQVIQLFKSNLNNKTMELLAQADLPNSKKLSLRIKAAGDSYNFYYAKDATKWILLKDKVDAKFLSTRTAGGFIGCIFGLYATSTGETSTNSVSFKSITYTGDDPMYK